ncbi:hypothetical protein OsI_12396 [Oryza sativa Indica Group]|uniref:Uncharacterized protein n=1 Tax=Oryza sativa subsp. indica TaxID=39946 RepID=B8AL78_ORYSI|nr:hypothetical protein OsI_12396 [Oryza sativa Indica Group]
MWPDATGGQDDTAHSRQAPTRRTPLPPAELAAAVCTLQVELLIATVSMALMSHRQLLPATARFTTGNPIDADADADQANPLSFLYWQSNCVCVRLNAARTTETEPASASSRRRPRAANEPSTQNAQEDATAIDGPSSDLLHLTTSYHLHRRHEVWSSGSFLEVLKNTIDLGEIAVRLEIGGGALGLHRSSDAATSPTTWESGS